MKKKKKQQDGMQVDMASDFDPQGSYTGKPADPLEKPVQDGDDI